MIDLAYTTLSHLKGHEDLGIAILQTQSNQQVINILALPPTLLSKETEVLPPHYLDKITRGGSFIINSKYKVLYILNLSS